MEINDRSGKLTVRRGKHDNYREIPLTLDVRKALSAYLEEEHPHEGDPEAPLWLGTRGQLSHRSSVTRMLQRWVRRYRADGLAGLAQKRRADRGQRRVPAQLQHVIKGLALQKSRPSAAAIHRQVAAVAMRHGWSVPSYSCVYDIVHNLDPGMCMLAYAGSQVYRRAASQSNQIWQADHIDAARIRAAFPGVLPGGIPSTHTGRWLGCPPATLGGGNL